MYLVLVGNISLELKSNLCDYPCMWRGVLTENTGCCYEFDSCWSKESEDLISTAEEIYMVIQKRITHARRKHKA